MVENVERSGTWLKKKIVIIRILMHSATQECLAPINLPQKKAHDVLKKS